MREDACKATHSQTISQPASQSASQPASQPASHSVSQSAVAWQRAVRVLNGDSGRIST